MVRRILFLIYRGYLRIPIAHGKGFASRVIGRLGLAEYSIRGIALELNPSMYIDRHLLSGKSHDPTVEEMIESCMKQGGIFVDIGANFGVFTLLAARMPDVAVYAFEPSPRELQRLYRNLARNRANNVIVFPFALGATRSRLTLNLSDESNSGQNTLIPSISVCPTETAECQCERFDRAIPAATADLVKLVKIDVEGFECEVLRGFGDLLGRMKAATFIVEVTPSLLERAGDSVDTLYQIFRDHGFTPKQLDSQPDQWNASFTYEGDL